MCSIHSLETDFVSLAKCHYFYREVTKRYIALKETAVHKDQHLPFVSSIFTQFYCCGPTGNFLYEKLNFLRMKICFPFRLFQSMCSFS